MRKTLITNKMKTIIFLLSTLLLVSCGPTITPEEEMRLTKSITKLRTEEDRLLESTHNLRDEYRDLNYEVSELKNEKGIYKSGKTPVYVLTLHFQEHKMELSLDRISFDFDVPVDEQFYKESRVGEQLGRGSRTFKMFHSGDITVTDKKIIYR